MKKLLLVTVAIIALATLTPVRAQVTGPGIPVFDYAGVTQLLKSVGIEGDQLTNLVKLYDQTVQVYTMATNIWNSVNGLAGAHTWAPGLQDPVIRNPLPFTAAQHPAWVGGFNDPSSMPFGAQYLANNTVGGDPSIYNDGTFAGGELLKAVRSLSSMQAVASTHLSAIETRINALATLFNELSRIDTVQKTDSLSARLHSELNYATSQQVQASQAMSAATLQLAVLENNQRQWQYQDEQLGITNACKSVAAAGGTTVWAACN